WTRVVSNFGKRELGSSSLSWGFDEKENESKAAKLKSPAKDCSIPEKENLVERNDPVRTSITLSDGKSTFFSANSEEHNQNSEKAMEPKKTVPVDGFPSVTKTPKRVTFSEASLNSESLSDTITMDSNICNDEPLVSATIASLDAYPSLPLYDPKTNYLSPRKPKLDDCYLFELLSENLSDTDGSESSRTEDLLEEFDGSSSEEAFTKATVDQEEEPAMPVAKQIDEPTLPIAEDISEAKMKSQSRSSTILRFLSLMLVLMIAFLSFSVTDSPIVATPRSIIDLRFSNVSIPSHILVLDFPVLAKANSYFKQFSGEAISYFSKLINDLGRIDDVHPIKFMNLTALEESSNIYHGYLKGSTGSEELDKKFEPIELEEDEESETELDEEEFQMAADLDEGEEVDIERVDVLEIEEASAIQLAKVNGADILEKDVKQRKHDLVETEKVFVVPAEGNEFDSLERDLHQGLTTSNVEVELAESQSFIVDNALESMIDNPESIVKEISIVEEDQPLEMMESPIRHDEDNAGAYQILEISSLVLSLLVGTVLYMKRRSDKTLHLVAVSKVDEAQSIEKKPRKSNKRESLVASEFSMGSPSYGSFTTYERIPAKHASGGEEVIIPIRRSSRIRSHVNFSMKTLKSRHCCTDN
ncbi:uncharacterized protein LOC124893692, partial [Capsicum annuum]|uniref:uncharacterized protein LOC124893692 n=1 Tax=Capsicum annuum TaxID=4072 RepID=UPI001FB149C4